MFRRSCSILKPFATTAGLRRGASVLVLGLCSSSVHALGSTTRADEARAPLNRLRESVLATPPYLAISKHGVSFDSIDPPESVASMLKIPGVTEFEAKTSERFCLINQRTLLSDSRGSVRLETLSLLRGRIEPSRASLEVWTPSLRFRADRPRTQTVELDEITDDPATVMFDQLRRGVLPWRFQSASLAFELLVRLLVDVLEAAPDTVVTGLPDGSVRISSEVGGVECEIEDPPGRLRRAALTISQGVRHDIKLDGMIGDPIFPAQHPRVWIDRTQIRGSDGTWSVDGATIRIYESVERKEHVDPGAFEWKTVATAAYRQATNDVINVDGTVDERATAASRSARSGSTVAPVDGHPASRPASPRTDFRVWIIGILVGGASLAGVVLWVRRRKG